MNYQSYDLGHQERGSTAVITLRGSAANVRLMDSSDFRSYKSGRRHKYIGGLAKSSPVRLAIPSSGHWYVTVDMTGLRGTARSSVAVEPPPLPTIRTSATNAPLRMIANEPPAGFGGDDSTEWDVFISHASEDKASVARPLADDLVQRGLQVWLDDYELGIGDSLRRKIDHGLARSRFGVVILSNSFFAKGWTQYELDGLVTGQVSGRQRLLPIWHNITKSQVMAASPSLADKIARNTTSSTIEEIAAEIAEVVRPFKESIDDIA